MSGVIKFFAAGFGLLSVLFVLGGIMQPSKKADAEEEEEAYVRLEPFKFRASEQGGSTPTLYFTVNEAYLEISPLTNSHYNYEIERLIYFGDEEAPIGFELNLTSFDGQKKYKAVIHRGRPKFHTAWKYKIHYKESSSFEEIKEVAKSAKQNIMCVDFIKL